MLICVMNTYLEIEGIGKDEISPQKSPGDFNRGGEHSSGAGQKEDPIRMHGKE